MKSKKKLKESKASTNTAAKNSLEAGLPQVKSSGSSYVRLDGLNPIENYGKIMYGADQENAAAPLSVPNGFVTEVTYRSGINSTIIQNPSPIPIQTYWHLVTSEPVHAMNMLYWVTQIVTRIGQFSSPNKEYQKHIRKALKNIGFIKLKKALASSVYMGVSALKLNWGVDEQTDRTIPTGIVYIPPESLMLAVIPEGALDPNFGVMQRYYGWNQQQQQPIAYGTNGAAPFASIGASQTPNRQVGINLTYVSALPKMWRIVHTFNPFGHTGNHWGFSFVQASYGFTCQKYNFVQKAQIAATYKSAPLTIIETNTETTVEYAPGKFEPLSTNLTKMLKTMAGTGYGIVDGLNAIKVNLIDNSADMEKMWYPVDKCDEQIIMAHCIASAVSNSGSYANAKVNSDNSKDLVNSITLQFIETLQYQLVEPALKAAFGDDIEEDDLGCFELKDNSLDDQVLWGQLALSLRNAGLFDPSNLDQVNSLLHKVGMQPVDKVSHEALIGALDPRETETNIGAAKQAIGKPYAKGLDNHEGKFE
jgi:hypothetical protein